MCVLQLTSVISTGKISCMSSTLFFDEWEDIYRYNETGWYSNLARNIGNNYNAILMELGNENKLSDKHAHLNPHIITH